MSPPYYSSTRGSINQDSSELCPLPHHHHPGSRLGSNETPSSSLWSPYVLSQNLTDGQQVQEDSFTNQVIIIILYRGFISSKQNSFSWPSTLLCTYILARMVHAQLAMESSISCWWYACIIVPIQAKVILVFLFLRHSGGRNVSEK